MARHWIGRPGYGGHGDAARYLSSAECADWLKSLSDERRVIESECLEWEASLDELQRTRDCLIDRAGTSLLVFPWSMYEHPQEQLQSDIEAIRAIIESNDAAADTFASREHQARRDRAEGFRLFQRSNLCIHAFARVASVEHFYNPKTKNRLSNRQIERVLREHMDRLTPTERMSKKR